MAGVGFGLFVVVDADEEEVAGIVGELGWIVLALDLVDGSVGILVVFQLDDQGRGRNVLAGDEHHVGKALAGGQLAKDDVIVFCVIVGNADHAGQRVLIIV